MDYQTYRQIKKPTQKRKTLTRNNFAEHNYNYVNKSQLTQPSQTNTYNQLFSNRQNFQQPSSNTVNVHDYPHISGDQSEICPFFQQNKKYLQQNRNRHQTPYYTPNYLSSDDDNFSQPDIFAPYTQEHKMQQPRPNPTSQNKNFYHKT